MRSFRKRYQITEEIARGGFGIVTRAEVKTSDQRQAPTHVAVKCIRHRAVREWTK
ncbi:Protein kinase domain containing protein, partial [Aphelenchoides avenae]